MAEIFREYTGRKFITVKDTCGDICKTTHMRLAMMQKQMQFEGGDMIMKTTECTKNRAKACTLLLTKK